MKALVRNNVVIDIEKRDINVFDYYHENTAKLFVDCPEDTDIGYLYENGVFINPTEPEGEE